MALRRKRVALGVVALAAAAIVLPPFINVNRYRLQVADAMSRALGQQVTIGGIAMRLAPQPGFTLQNVVVADDPSINAEPLLRAPEVTASLRLSSLWRGRLEIAKLSLSDPSLNLARAPDGRWNLQSLFEKVAQTPAAPTAKIRPETRPRFPYIEAHGGRINLKLGAEKTVWALSDAQFALWLASENEWQIRLRAQPLRTDTNLSDTGTVRVEGSLGRAERLSLTPLNLRMRLEGAQLGQLTHIIFGRDRGWRGTAGVDAQLKGTPELLQASAAAQVEDFRRYDIMSGGALRLAARCQAHLSITQQRASGLDCQAPVSGGTVLVRGEAQGLTRERSYEISVAVENLPAGMTLELVRRMKRDLPDDLQAAGTVDAAFSLLRTAGHARLWTGAGNANNLELRSRQLDDPLQLGSVRFVLNAGDTPAGQNAGDNPGQAHPFLQVAFPVRLGGASPAQTQARFSGAGYALRVQGDAALPRLLQVARAIGVAAPQTIASGPARVDLQIAGGWTGFAAPQVNGSAQLRNVSARIPGFAQEMQFASAAVTLAPDAIRVQNLTGRFARSSTLLSGSLSMVRGCAAEPCPVQFQLHADQLSSDELNRLVNPRLRPRPWYQMIGLSSGPEKSPLSSLEAKGQITIGHATLKTLAADHVSAQVQISKGRMVLSNVRAEVLGGKHLGVWQADFSGSAPEYSGEGTLQGVALARVSELMQDQWATGTADLRYRAHASGWNAQQLLSSAGGSLRFDWRDGALSRVTLGEGSAPLRIRRFAGEVTLRDGLLAFSPSKMETADGIYSVSGTASLDQQIKLSLARDGVPAYELSGTVRNPKVSRAAQAAAGLR